MKKGKSIKFSESARREAELSRYGKLLSLRPSRVHSSKKDYKREKRIKPEEYED